MVVLFNVSVKRYRKMWYGDTTGNTEIIFSADLNQNGLITPNLCCILRQEVSTGKERQTKTLIDITQQAGASCRTIIGGIELGCLGYHQRVHASTTAVFRRDDTACHLQFETTL